MSGKSFCPLWYIVSLVESRSVRDQLAPAVWVSCYWSEELPFPFYRMFILLPNKTWETCVYCNLYTVLYYGALALVVKRHRKRLVSTYKAAFLPTAYFTRRNRSLKSVIFLDAYYCMKYYSNTILQCTNCLFFVQKYRLCIGKMSQCIGIFYRDAIVILSRSRRPEDRDRRKWYMFPGFPKTILCFSQLIFL